MKFIEYFMFNLKATFSPCIDCDRTIVPKVVMRKSSNKAEYIVVCRTCWMKRVEERLNQLEELLGL